MKTILLKITALFTSLTFIFPIMAWSFEPGLYTLRPESLSTFQWQGKTITLPRQCGKIEKKFPGQDKLIIHIQDLHCNHEVQRNIARIIQVLAKDAGATGRSPLLVGEEGAFYSPDVNPIRGFPIPEIREAVSDYFVKQGKLTGAEYYAATGKYPVRLEGIETPKLYNDSLAAVRSFLNPESQGDVMDLREMLNSLKPGIYNQELSALDRARTEYREGKLDVLAYATRLTKFAYRIVGARHAVPLRQYPNLENYLNLGHKLFGPGVEPDQLFREMDELDHALREALYTTQAQRDLDKLGHRLDIIERLLNISATQEEVREFRNGREKFRVGKFVEFIQTAGNSPRMRGAQRDCSLQQNHEIDPDLYTLDHYLTEVDKFYRLSDLRSHSFITNLLKKMDAGHQTVAVIITGGFHTDGLLAGLHKQGFECLSIKPRLTKQDVANPYFSILQGKKLPLEKLLAKNQTLLAPRDWTEVDGGLSFINSVHTAETAATIVMPGFSHDQQGRIWEYLHGRSFGYRELTSSEFQEKTGLEEKPRGCQAYVIRAGKAGIPILIFSNGTLPPIYRSEAFSPIESRDILFCDGRTMKGAAESVAAHQRWYAVHVAPAVESLLWTLKNIIPFLSGRLTGRALTLSDKVMRGVGVLFRVGVLAAVILTISVVVYEASGSLFPAALATLITLVWEPLQKVFHALDAMAHGAWNAIMPVPKQMSEDSESKLDGDPAQAPLPQTPEELQRMAHDVINALRSNPERMRKIYHDMLESAPGYQDRENLPPENWQDDEIKDLFVNKTLFKIDYITQLFEGPLNDEQRPSLVKMYINAVQRGCAIIHALEPAVWRALLREEKWADLALMVNYYYADPEDRTGKLLTHLENALPPEKVPYRTVLEALKEASSEKSVLTRNQIDKAPQQGNAQLENDFAREELAYWLNKALESLGLLPQTLAPKSEESPVGLVSVNEFDESQREEITRIILDANVRLDSPLPLSPQPKLQALNNYPREAALLSSGKIPAVEFPDDFNWEEQAGLVLAANLTESEGEYELYDAENFRPHLKLKLEQAGITYYYTSATGDAFSICEEKNYPVCLFGGGIKSCFGVAIKGQRNEKGVIALLHLPIIDGHIPPIDILKKDIAKFTNMGITNMTGMVHIIHAERHEEDDANVTMNSSESFAKWWTKELGFPIEYVDFKNHLNETAIFVTFREVVFYDPEKPRNKISIKAWNTSQKAPAVEFHGTVPGTRLPFKLLLSHLENTVQEPVLRGKLLLMLARAWNNNFPDAESLLIRLTNLVLAELKNKEAASEEINQAADRLLALRSTGIPWTEIGTLRTKNKVSATKPNNTSTTSGEIQPLALPGAASAALLSGLLAMLAFSIPGLNMALSGFFLWNLVKAGWIAGQLAKQHGWKMVSHLDQNVGAYNPALGAMVDPEHPSTPIMEAPFFVRAHEQVAHRWAQIMVDWILKHTNGKSLSYYAEVAQAARVQDQRVSWQYYLWNVLIGEILAHCLDSVGAMVVGLRLFLAKVPVTDLLQSMKNFIRKKYHPIRLLIAAPIWLKNILTAMIIKYQLKRLYKNDPQSATILQDRLELTSANDTDALGYLLEDINWLLKNKRDNNTGSYYRIKNNPKVSIVILHYGKDSQATLDLLGSLQHQTYSNFDIILVDNNSPDSFSSKFSSLELRTRYPRLANKISLISNKVNLSYTGGNNQAARIAINEHGSDYVLYLNNDAILEKDGIEKLVTAVKDNPEIGAVQPSILFDDTGRLLQEVKTTGTLSDRETAKASIYEFIAKETSKKDVRPVFEKKDLYYKQRSLLGTAHMVRSDMLRLIGGFDTRFFMFVDEFDMGYRYTISGLNLAMHSDALLLHPTSTSLNRILFYAEYYCLRNRMLLGEKHINKGEIGRKIVEHTHQFNVVFSPGVTNIKGELYHWIAPDDNPNNDLLFIVRWKALADGLLGNYLPTREKSTLNESQLLQNYADEFNKESTLAQVFEDFISEENADRIRFMIFAFAKAQASLTKRVPLSRELKNQMVQILSIYIQRWKQWVMNPSRKKSTLTKLRKDFKRETRDAFLRHQKAKKGSVADFGNTSGTVPGTRLPQDNLVRLASVARRYGTGASGKMPGTLSTHIPPTNISFHFSKLPAPPELKSAMTVRVDGARKAAGRVLRVDPAQAVLELWHDPGMLGYDFTKYSAGTPSPGSEVGFRRASGKTIQEIMESEPEAIAAINGQTDNMWCTNSLMVVNGEVIERSAPGVRTDRFIEPEGVFSFFVLDPGQVGIQEVEFKNGQPVKPLTFRNGLACPPLIQHHELQKKIRQSQPNTRPNEVLWDPESTQFSASAIGKDDHGNVCLITLLGDPDQGNEIRLQDVIDLGQRMNLADMSILGVSGDAQQSLVGVENPNLIARARAGSSMAIYSEGRPLSSAILVKRRSTPFNADQLNRKSGEGHGSKEKVPTAESAQVATYRIAFAEGQAEITVEKDPSHGALNGLLRESMPGYFSRDRAEAAAIGREDRPQQFDLACDHHLGVIHFLFNLFSGNYITSDQEPTIHLPANLVDWYTRPGWKHGLAKILLKAIIAFSGWQRYGVMARWKRIINHHQQAGDDMKNAAQLLARQVFHQTGLSPAALLLASYKALVVSPTDEKELMARLKLLHAMNAFGFKTIRIALPSGKPLVLPMPADEQTKLAIIHLLRSVGIEVNRQIIRRKQRVIGFLESV